jgi:hypothetical protein
MSLDGHMVITTISEYVQAWLTYVEPEEEIFDEKSLEDVQLSKKSKYEIKIDEKRKINYTLNLEKNLKIKNRSIFKSHTTVSDAYSKLLKNISTFNKTKNEVSRDSITKSRTSQIIGAEEK